MEVSEWKDRFLELDESRKNVVSRLNRLKRSFMNLENEHNVKVKQLELEKLKATEWQQRFERVEAERAEAAKEGQKLKAMDDAVSGLKAERDGLRSVNVDLKATMSSMAESVKALRLQIEAKAEELAAAKAEVAALKE